MNRWFIGCLATVLAVGVVASDASAQRRRKGKNKPAQEEAPVSEELSRSMGEVRWGMTRAEVQKLLEKGIADKFRPKLAAARDALQEDQLRDAAREEIRSLRASYASFDGTRTGWDASFLRDEFTHGNGESMVVLKDDNSQNFYFFFNDHLWKWFKAFNAEVFEGQTFEQFQAAIQRRFGNGKENTGELSPGGAQRHWIEWQDENSRLRAVDQTSFYGFYCLVFEEKATLGRLASLRPSSGRERRGGDSLVDAVTSGDHEVQDHDDSPNIVDRITGRIRQREDAPAPSASGGATQARSGATQSGTRGQSRTSSSASAPTTSVSESDDPLSGLGL